MVFDCDHQPNNPSSDLFQGMVLINSSYSNIGSTSGTSLTKNNMAPGTYYLKLTSNAALKGQYKFKITKNTTTPYYWTGASNTNWHTTSNWSSCIVPTSSTSVIIPNTTNKPRIYASNTGYCKNIQVQSNNGAKLTIEAGAHLEITD